MGLLEDGLKEDELSMGLSNPGIMAPPPRTETSLWPENCRKEGCKCGGHMLPDHPEFQTEDITTDIVTSTIKSDGTIETFSRPRGISHVYTKDATVDPGAKEPKPTEVRRIPPGHIPIASLLGGELDHNFMLPQPPPPVPSQAALSSSAAASTLPTPPPSTTSTEGNFLHSPSPSFLGTNESLSSTINGLDFGHHDIYKEPTPAPDYMDIDRGDHAPPVPESSSASLSRPSPPATLESSRRHLAVDPKMAHPSPLPFGESVGTVLPPRQPSPARTLMDVDQAAVPSTSSLTPPTFIPSHRPKDIGRVLHFGPGPSKFLSQVPAAPNRQPSPVPMEVDPIHGATFPPNSPSINRPAVAGAEPYSTSVTSSSSGFMNYPARTRSFNTTFSVAHVRTDHRSEQPQPGQLTSTPGASTSKAHLKFPPSRLDSVGYTSASDNQEPANRSVPPASIANIIDATRQTDGIPVPPSRVHPMPRPQLTLSQTSSSSSYPLPSTSPLLKSPFAPSKAQQPSTKANVRPGRVIPGIVLTTSEVEQQGEPAPDSPSYSPRSPKGKGRPTQEDNPEPDQVASPSSSSSRIVRIADESESQPTSPVSPIDSGSSGKTLKGVRKFACQIPGCGKTFTRKNDVTRHMKSAAAHRDFTSEDVNSEARCAKCNRILSRFDSAKRHEGSSACGKRVLPSELKTKVAKTKKKGKRTEQPEDGGE